MNGGGGSGGYYGSGGGSGGGGGFSHGYGGPLARPHSEADFSELDENAQMALDSMNEDDINQAFEKMLDDMNLSEEKKEPLRLQPVLRKKEMLSMHMKGTVQVSTWLDAGPGLRPLLMRNTSA